MDIRRALSTAVIGLLLAGFTGCSVSDIVEGQIEKAAEKEGVDVDVEIGDGGIGVSGTDAEGNPFGGGIQVAPTTTCVDGYVEHDGDVIMSQFLVARGERGPVQVCVAAFGPESTLVMNSDDTPVASSGELGGTIIQLVDLLGGAILSAGAIGPDAALPDDVAASLRDLDGSHYQVRRIEGHAEAVMLIVGPAADGTKSVGIACEGACLAGS